MGIKRSDAELTALVHSGAIYQHWENIQMIR